MVGVSTSLFTAGHSAVQPESAFDFCDWGCESHWMLMLLGYVNCSCAFTAVALACMSLFPQDASIAVTAIQVISLDI